MTLQEWAKKVAMSDATIARELGVAASTVWRWRKGIVLPSAWACAELEQLTEGAVTLQDFYPHNAREE
jgi:DNA-binding transcriptional regulator YdaS (Cro superfamily)